MIDMGMGNKKKINMCRVINAYVPIAFFHFGIALMHAAINSESRFVCFYDETGTGNLFCCSKKFNFHEKSILVNFIFTNINLKPNACEIKKLHSIVQSFIQN